MSKLREIKLPKFEGKGGMAYCGRSAGGEGRKFGGQYLIIAANEEVLAAVWEALEGVPLDHELVYEAGAIKTGRIEALADELRPSGNSKP